MLPVGIEDCSLGASHAGDPRGLAVVIGIILLDDTDVAFAARHIDTASKRCRGRAGNATAREGSGLGAIPWNLAQFATDQIQAGSQERIIRRGDAVREPGFYGSRPR